MILLEVTTYDFVDELVLIVPAGIVIAVLGLAGYRIKKTTAKRSRVSAAHQPPPQVSDGDNDG